MVGVYFPLFDLGLGSMTCFEWWEVNCHILFARARPLANLSSYKNNITELAADISAWEIE